MDMRGLAHFIQDIRKATGNKKEEESRVDEELAKIRATFIDTAHMTSYQRKKYVCKLMFISMLGYPITFGHIEGIKLMAEQTPAEKLIGYLSTNVLMTEESGILALTTHTVYKDLLSGSDFNRGLALGAISSTGGRDYAETMVEGVQAIVLDDAADPHLRKKAVLTLLQIYNHQPELVDLPSVVPKVGQMLESELDGVIMCAVTMLNGCIRKENEHLFSGIPGKLIDILHRIIVEKQTDPGYVYYGVPAPWLQSKVLRFLQYFPAPQDDDLRARVVTVIRKIVRATDKVLRDAQTQQKQRGTQNRVSAMNAVLYEVISLCIQWEISSTVVLDCVNIISGFICDKKEANLRYLGLSLLSRLSFTDVPEFDFQAYCRQYQPNIIVALHDADVSIRKSALEVLVAMCNSANYTDIIREILSFLPIAEDPVFRSGLVLSVAFLADKYGDDENWYVGTLLTLISQAGDTCPPEIAYRALQVIIADPSVQKRAAGVVFTALRTRKSLPPLLAQTTAFILGEVGYQIALNPESTPLIQAELLQEHFTFAAPATQAVILTALFKFYNLYDAAAVRERVVRALRACRAAADAELQQRATEYLALIDNSDPELLSRVLESIPPFTARVGSALDRAGRRSRRTNDIWTAKLLARGRAGGGGGGGSSDDDEEADRHAGGFASGPAEPVRLSGAGSTTTRRRDARAQDEEIAALFTVSAAPDAEALVRSYAAARRLYTAALTAPGAAEADGAAAGPWLPLLSEPGVLEVRCRVRYALADARVELRVTNTGGEPLAGVALTVLSTELGLLLEGRHERLPPGVAALAPGESHTAEYAARCAAPFTLPPTLQLATAAGAPLVLSLPLSAARFVTAYATAGEAELEELVANVKSTSGILSRDVAKPGPGAAAAALAALAGMGYARARDSAIAAAASQPRDRAVYEPVVCEVSENRAGVRLTAYGASPLLQRAVLDLAEAAVETLARH